MKFAKKALLLTLTVVVAAGCVALTGCGKAGEDEYEGVVVKDNNQMSGSDGEEIVSMAKYIDENFPNRDCKRRAKAKKVTEWITSKLTSAGYDKDDIQIQEFKMNKFKRIHNIILTKEGKSDETIIVGAHYDGDGITDNGSGMALLLYEACKLEDNRLPYTVKFIFFTGEEYGLLGSNYYAEHMTQAEAANTKYMINMDSIAAGDYCYLYGGIADDKTKTVTDTETFDWAYDLSEDLGLGLKKNPWTYEKPEPGADVPFAASPTTLKGCSDYAAFSEMLGIQYVYFESTNWEVGDYDGYTETKACGEIMNTEKDYFDFIETHFPGRYLDHVTRYEKLLHAMLTGER